MAVAAGGHASDEASTRSGATEAGGQRGTNHTERWVSRACPGNGQLCEMCGRPVAISCRSRAPRGASRRAFDKRDQSCTSAAPIHDSDVTQPPPPTWLVGITCSHLDRSEPCRPSSRICVTSSPSLPRTLTTPASPCRRWPTSALGTGRSRPSSSSTPCRSTFSVAASRSTCTPVSSRRTTSTPRACARCSAAHSGAKRTTQAPRPSSS